MLHPIKLPDCGQQMDSIARFLEGFIEFICGVDTPAMPQLEDFQQAFGKTLGTRFFRWLGAKKQSTPLAASAEEQSNSPRKRRKQKQQQSRYNYLSQILQALQADPTMRQIVLNAYRNDVTFFEHLQCNDANFHFEFNTLLSEDMRNLFSFLWEGFYTTLFATRGGFFREVVDFDRKQFLAIFWKQNEDLKVCPGCDGQRPSLIEQYRCVEVDHTFPKSLYPFMILTIANLVPLCLECNDKLKHFKDPLDHTLPDPLLHTFHPYGKPAFQEDEQKNTAIKIIVSRKEANGERQVRIVEQNTTSSKRIQKLDELFGLEKRWNEHLQILIGRLAFTISHSTKDRRKASWTIDDHIESVLEEYIEGKRSGWDTYYAVEREYASYAFGDPGERAELIKQAMIYMNMESDRS